MTSVPQAAGDAMDTNAEAGANTDEEDDEANGKPSVEVLGEMTQASGD